MKWAQQRYYESLEADAFLRQQAEKCEVPGTVWEEANTAASLAGRRFGRWLVCDDAVRSTNGTRRWRCRCSCGTEKYVSERSLLEGKSQSCGCYAVDRVKEELIRDLTGQTFGALYVLGRAETPAGRKGVWWNCQCTCGQQIPVLASDLSTGRKTHCGCQRKGKGKELAGKRFGMLTVLYDSKRRSKAGSIIWICRCDCGKELELSTHRLLHGSVKSCGCNAEGIDEAAE